MAKQEQKTEKKDKPVAAEKPAEPKLMTMTQWVYKFGDEAKEFASREEMAKTIFQKFVDAKQLTTSRKTPITEATVRSEINAMIADFKTAKTGKRSKYRVLQDDDKGFIISLRA
jgi:hypothetical protein